jgi:hypothetical protein
MTVENNFCGMHLLSYLLSRCGHSVVQYFAKIRSIVCLYTLSLIVIVRSSRVQIYTWCLLLHYGMHYFVWYAFWPFDTICFAIYLIDLP